MFNLISVQNIGIESNLFSCFDNFNEILVLYGVFRVSKGVGSIYSGRLTQLFYIGFNWVQSSGARENVDLYTSIDEYIGTILGIDDIILVVEN